MIKKFLLIVCIVVLGLKGWGQVYFHNFGTTSITTKPYTGTPNTFNANLSSSSWTTNASAWSGLAGNGGGSSMSLSLTNSSGTPTYTLTFNIAAGFQLAITHFDFWRVRSTSGAQNWAMTINGTSVGSGTVPTTGASLGSTAVSSPISGLTGTVTIVLTMSGASGTGTFRLDDFTLNGSVTSSADPLVAISNQHPSATNFSQGSNNNIIGIYQLDVTDANATLTGISATTAGTYTSSDINGNGFKYWINNATNLSGATQLGTSQAGVGNGGTVAVSGLSQSITSGTTRYILLTADIASAAVATNTISLTTTSFANITFSSADKTGTNPVAATNTHTIVACTPVNATSVGATNGNTQSIVSWTNPECFDELMIIASTATIGFSPTGDGTAYSANLAYGSGTDLGSNRFVVFKGSTSPQTVTGLSNGTQYFFKIFTRKGTTWSSGIETSATPATVSAATDYFRSNVCIVLVLVDSFWVKRVGIKYTQLSIFNL